jgi:hypothetical protein
MKGQSEDTLTALWCKQGKREDALLLLREKNEKEIANRQAALMSIREGIAKDIADTHRTNNELSANLASIKQLMDTNAEKNQSTFDKIVANQSIFHCNLREMSTSMATTNGTLATIATTVSSITQSTADTVEAAVTGITTLMVKEIGNIADTIARVEGNMAVLRNLVTLVQTAQVDAPTVPTNTGPTECSDDDGDPTNLPPGLNLLSLQDRFKILDDADDQPHDANRGPSPGFRSLQDWMHTQDILDNADGRPHNASHGPTPGFWSLQGRMHTMDATNDRNTPVGGNTSDDAGAHAAPQVPSALRGQPKSPTDPSGFLGSGLGINDPTRVPRPGTPIPNKGSATRHGGVASLNPAPAADVPDFKLNGHFSSGFGRPDASWDAWAASARHHESLAARNSGKPLHMDLCMSPFSNAPVGDTIGHQQSIKDGSHQHGHELQLAPKGQYQDSHGYDMTSGYVRPTHHDEKLSGGCIVSPRHANCRRQAMANKVSPLNIDRLGDVRYHGGVKGYVPLTMNVVHRCGYTEVDLSDVIASYQTIIHVHNFVLGKWEDRYHNRGSQLDKILEKGQPTFPRLTLINVESTVEFYDAFQKTSMIYLLALMPFDCISIKMGFKALCPPGMGLPWYTCIA